MNITNLKASPIVWYKEAFKPQKREIDFVKALPLKQLYNKDVTGTVDSYIFKNNKLKRLKDLALKCADQYVKEILEIDIDYYLTQSWASITSKNKNHHSHMHRNTLFGGVMYLQAERDKGGELMVDCGRSMLEEGFNFEYNIKNYNIYNSSRYKYPVGTGDIVIFPGWLSHYTLPNLSNEDRIAVGFDFFIKGDFGSDNQWSKITI